jgi:hypothetical protein
LYRAHQDFRIVLMLSSSLNGPSSTSRLAAIAVLGLLMEATWNADGAVGFDIGDATGFGRVVRLATDKTALTPIHF